MLIALPLSVLACLWIVHLGRQAADDEAGIDWRDALLRAVVSWGALVVILLEGLGIPGLINQPSVALAWLALLALCLGWGLSSGALRKGWDRVRRLRPPDGWLERVLLLGIFAIAAVLLAVALASPPNNVDSLHYHMTRVVHWAQNGSLDHYAAGYHPQLLYPHWAELNILNLRSLWGSDRLAALVQWSSMVGTIIAATRLAAMLGSRLRAQLAAGAFVISVPMGVLQSTSTQNDYVVAFWAVTVAYFVIRGWRRPASRVDLAYMATAAALGTLTKGTFVVFALPFLASYFWKLLRDSSLWRMVAAAAFLTSAFVVFNLGVWQRNLQTYGGLYGDADRLGSELAFPSAFASAKAKLINANGALDQAGLAPAAKELFQWGSRRVAHAAALNLLTPSQYVNSLLWGALERMPGVVGQATFDALENAAWNHEDTAGNPLHLATVPLGLLVLVIAWFRRRNGQALAYALLSVLTFLLLPLVITLAGSPFGARFQLPFFALWAPVVGAALATIRIRWLSGLASGLLIVVAIPYVLLNNTRPVLGRPPWPTRVHSVFIAPAAEIAFSASPALREPFTLAATEIRGLGCQQVGLRIDSGDLEYLFWWLLEAPQSGTRIEIVDPLPSLSPLVDPEFEPCAIICTTCGGQAVLDQLPLHRDFGFVRLYAGMDAKGEPGD